MPKGNQSGLGFWGARHSFGGEDHTWKGHLAILPQTGIFDIYNRGWEARCKREGTTDGISGDWLEMGPGTGGNTAVDGESAAEVTPLEYAGVFCFFRLKNPALFRRCIVCTAGIKWRSW